MVMEEILKVEVRGCDIHPFFRFLRAATAIFVLIASLLLYLTGILLTLTIIGALIGIPLIMATYVIDAIAIMALMNMREKIHIVRCPECSKRLFVMISLRERFVCKRCKNNIKVEAL